MILRIGMSARSVFAVALMGIFSGVGAHDSHPQEVLDLVAAYEGLAMKVRPLQDRVIVRQSDGKTTGFKPDGTPVRAKADPQQRIGTRIAALEQKVRAEIERIHKPGFAVRDEESASIRFGDGRRGARLSSGDKPQNSPGADPGVDARTIADARKRLAKLQREYAGLEREVKGLERR